MGGSRRGHAGKPFWSGTPAADLLLALLRRRRLAVVGVVEVVAAAGVPAGALVAVGGYAAGVLEQPGQVQQVPGHERGVAVGEVVVRAAGARVEVGRPGPGFADPPGIGLRRGGVPEVLQGVKDVHRAVLDAVLLAGGETAGHAAVAGALAGVVEDGRGALKPRRDPPAGRR